MASLGGRVVAWRTAWTALALAASCATAEPARAGPQSDVDRALRQGSAPERADAEETSERHEGPQMGREQHAREEERSPGSASEKPEEKGEHGEHGEHGTTRERQIDELRREARHLREELDRMEAKERERTRDAEQKGRRTSKQAKAAEREGRRPSHDEAHARPDRGEPRSSGKEEQPAATEAKEPRSSKEERPKVADDRHVRDAIADLCAAVGAEERRRAPSRDEKHEAKSASRSRDHDRARSSSHGGSSEAGGGGSEHASHGSSRQGRRAAGRASTAPARASSVEGDVAASSGRQIVLRADGGNLMLVEIGDDTVIHRGDVQLEANALVRGTPVRVRYRPARSGELHAVEVELTMGE